MTQSNAPDNPNKSDQNSPNVKNEGGINTFGGSINTINYYQYGTAAPASGNASPAANSNDGSKYMQLTPDQKKQMRLFIVDRYDIQEFRNLCEDLGEDYDNLAGEAKESKARELISYLERRRDNVKLYKALQDIGFNFN